MIANKSLLLLPGDGIGPEVMGEVERVIDWLDAKRRVSFGIERGLVGGSAYDAEGVPVTDATVAKAAAADAVLLGAVGGAKWETLPFEFRPERGLLRLRKDMALFANLRPATVFDALVDWTEKGTPAGTVIATKYSPDNKVLMTRPLCPYPEIAKYKGTGDTNDAASFACRKP